MTLLAISDFLGRFHPLLVHLPVGILLLAVLFQWILLFPRWANLKPAIPVMFFWGMLAAVFSCITGYLLSLSGDYDVETTDRHQWMGIYTAVASLAIYILHRINLGEWINRVAGLIVLVLVSLTGHLGGTLTHGEGYLTEGWNKADGNDAIWKPMTDVQEATVYNDLVQPLLQARCYNCHGSTKQKGKLRLDGPEFINKGGEEGKIIVPGKADESALIERLLLPLNDDEHMPPKEKPQLTQTEVALLHWWIQNGADYEKKVSDLNQDDKIKPVLMSIQSGTQAAIMTKESEVPTENVEAADDAILQQLKDGGVMIIPVAANTNYLQANFFTARSNIDSLIALLPALKKQLIWLKLDGIALSDGSMKNIGQLANLRRLHLSNTPLTDAGAVYLKNLLELRSLNLFATQVTTEGLKNLEPLKQLQHVYLYQTKVGGAEYSLLKQILPQAKIDTGGYIVPTFETDTTELKY